MYAGFARGGIAVYYLSMTQRAIFTLVFVCVLAVCGLAQGGKAEPKRFDLPAAVGSIVLSATLSNSQEMEYVFSGKKGQVIVLKMNRTSLFDYRVFNEEFELETEFESSPTLELELPGTGDYLLFVRKKMVAKPRTASFRLTVTVRPET